MSTKRQESSDTTTQNEPSLPRGLYRRGNILWINKKIGDRRFQFSTATDDPQKAAEAYSTFLREHGIKESPEAREPSVESRRKLPKGLYWKGNVIWLSRLVNGKHYNISTGTSDPKLAEQFLADFNLKAFKGEKLGVKLRHKATFGDLANRYIEQGRLNGLRRKTVTRYAAVRDHFLDFLRSRGLIEADASTLGPVLIEEYKQWRARTPLNRNGWPVKDGEEPDSGGASARTLQLEVQSIGTFFRHAARLGLVEDNPVSRIRPIRLSQRTPVYLDADEVRRFLQAAATYDDWARSRYPIGSFLRDILVTYLKTGMRLEELRYLEWSDVDMKQGEVIVRGEKEVEDRQEIPISPETLRALRQLGEEKFDALDVEGKQQILGRRLAPKRELVNLRYKDFGLKEGILARGSRVKWNPKTKGRVVPISPGLLPILESLPRNGNLVYPDPQTGGLWRLKINRLVKRCAEHAGITKNVHTHVLRHTFATQLRQRGVPLETIKELLGHADIRETLIYAHFSPEEARAAIPKIDFF